MNERQKRFVDAYIQTANASESARRAGYSEKTAGSIGERLLKNVEVRTEINRRLEQFRSQQIAETQDVLEHLTAVLRGQVTVKVISSNGKMFEIPVPESDRLKAADMLLKVFGAYRQQIDVQISPCEKFQRALEKLWADDPLT